MDGETATPYRYDPESLWVYVQRGEPYVNAHDHLDAALEAIEKHGGDGYEPEEIGRSRLERVAPVLLDLCRRIPPGVLPAVLETDLRKAAEYAGRTEYVEDIVAATRKWWDAGPSW